VNPARREPLLWLQLLGLAALPLEALLLLLILAGADPGPFPGFERVLAWALGALAPAALFWRLPPDLWSLLLVQVPLRGRRPEQLRLSALQGTLPLKLLSAAGAILLLPLLWWADASAGLAWAWSPFSASPRLVVLLVSVPLLALMLWQWQQLIQAVWMLTRPASLVDQTLPLTQAIAAETRLNAGLPLLLLAPLEIDAPSESPVAPRPEPTANVSEPTADASEAPSAAESEQDEAEAKEQVEIEVEVEIEAEVEAEPEPEPIEAALPEPSVQAEAPVQPEPDPDPSDDDPAASDAAVVDVGVAVTPEQAAEEDKGTNLDS
jgi:hypothetical protein